MVFHFPEVTGNRIQWKTIYYECHLFHTTKLQQLNKDLPRKDFNKFIHFSFMTAFLRKNTNSNYIQEYYEDNSNLFNTKTIQNLRQPSHCMYKKFA